MATKKPSNPFDSIAKSAAPKKAASNKIAAVVNDEVSNNVDTIISLKAKIKQLEADLDKSSDLVRDFIFIQQAEHARKGNYAKTFDVQGKVGALTYIASDRWTLPKEAEVIEALLKFLGPKRYEEWFQSIRVIKVKESLMENQELLNKIIKLIGDAGLSLGDAFDVTDTLKSKKDLDENQFDLSDKELAQFRTICKQYKAGLK
jgi:hypothetical protein